MLLAFPRCEVTRLALRDKVALQSNVGCWGKSGSHCLSYVVKNRLELPRSSSTKTSPAARRTTNTAISKSIRGGTDYCGVIWNVPDLSPLYAVSMATPIRPLATSATTCAPRGDTRKR